MKFIPTITTVPPVLDEETFQRLLAAAHVMQQRNDRYVDESKSGNVGLSENTSAENAQPVQVLPLTRQADIPNANLALDVLPGTRTDVEPLAAPRDSLIPPETAYQLSALASQLEAMTQGDIRTNPAWKTRAPAATAWEISAVGPQNAAGHVGFQEEASFQQPTSEPRQLIPMLQSAASSETNILPHRIVRRRISQSHNLLLKTAMVVAIGVLLAGSIHRFSPLPGGLVLNSLHSGYGSEADIIAADTAQVVSEVQNRIRADRRLQMTRVRVRESNGIITLSGDVGSSAERIAAVQDAGQIKAVKVIVDNLRVIDPKRQSPTTAVQPSVARPARRSKAPTISRAGSFHVAVLANSLRRPGLAETIGASSSRRATASPTSVAPAASISSDTHSKDSKASGVSAGASSPVVGTPLRAPKQVTVPDGTVLAVRLTKSLSSDLNQRGDTFLANLAFPIMVGERVVIPAEAAIQGKIVDVRSAGRFNGRAALVIKVTRLAYNGGGPMSCAAANIQSRVPRGTLTQQRRSEEAQAWALLSALSLAAKREPPSEP